jgi:hypothetical protein
MKITALPDNNAPFHYIMCAAAHVLSALNNSSLKKNVFISAATFYFENGA